MSRRESKGILIERGDDRLTVVVRTRRSGDLLHLVFGPLAVAFGSLVLWIALANGTLFASWVTLPLVLACLAYGWFTLTRIFNRRRLVAGAETLSVHDGPLFSLSRGYEVPLPRVGKVKTRKEKRWIPPIWTYEVWHVEAAGAPRALFRNLAPEDDALRIAAAVVAHLGRHRRPTAPSEAPRR